MNLTTTGIGLAMIAYGLLTTGIRLWRPSAFSKLAAMQTRWGDKAGFWVHVFGYSVSPIIVGTVIAVEGWLGAALF